MTSIAVIGSGISGLVGAWQMISHHPDVHIDIYEAGDRVGGKLRQEVIAGHRVDVGAESGLWRRPELIQLLEELSIDSVHPGRLPALVWSRGSLEKLPTGTLMGIPSEPASARGILTEDEIIRAENEHPVSIDGDISVGDAVAQACGDAVVDRLVEPLLGGVYAGNARELSARSAVPPLYSALVAGKKLRDVAATSASAVSSNAAREVFGAPAGGMGALPEYLQNALEKWGVRFHLRTEVTGLAKHDASWLLSTTSASEPLESLDDIAPGEGMYDAVLLALPAPAAAKLLQGIAPEAAGILADVECASMAIVTYAFDASLAEKLPASSGFLVPPIDGRDIKASTFSSAKWPWLRDAAPEVTYLRVSFGRHRDDDILKRTDDELVSLGLADLSRALGFSLSNPIESHVQRWDDGLPQYFVGHDERMALLAESLSATRGLDVAGSAFGGVGIPACIATARAAATRILNDLANDRVEGEGR